MGSSFCALWYHVVFATKYREPWMDGEIRERLLPYFGGVVRNFGGTARCIGGVADHVHMVMGLPQDLALASAVRTIKTNSSKWVHQTCPHLSDFAWQDGNAGFSVSVSQLDRVEAYVAGQGEHHRKHTFGEELREFLVRHGVDHLPEYLPT